jgi:hypothetical protein
MKKWERKQLKGVNNLKSICEERGKTLLKDIKLIDDAIKKLEDEFKPKGDADFTEVYNDWQLICLASYKDVDDYVEKFNDLYGQLQELDFTLPRIELVMKFIHGLGQLFSSWHQSLSVQYDITATNVLSLTEVQGKARVEERRMNREDTQTALLAKQVRQNQHSHQQKRKRDDEEDNSRPFCNPCNKIGHWESTCWKTHPDLEEKWRKNYPAKAAALDARVKKRGKRRKTESSSDAKPQEHVI